MKKLGIIGTSPISHENVKGALASGFFQLEVVYSRKLETARVFGESYGVTKFETDLESFVNREDLDIIYIASPNSLHFEQACLALAAKKHVVVEKPAFVSLAQWQKAHDLAKENGVFLFDAIRHAYEDNFKLVTQEVAKLAPIEGAIFQYQQYSSKIDGYRQGQIASCFSLEMAGGALMDLGVYALYAAVSWFGRPLKVSYQADILETGIDGGGLILLHYPGFKVHIHVSKTRQSYLPSEIFSRDTTLIIDAIGRVDRVIKKTKKTNQEEVLAESPGKDRMVSEWRFFAEVLDGKNLEDYAAITEVGEIVMDILTVLRHPLQTNQ